jgi:hypothetical protein
MPRALVDCSVDDLKRAEQNLCAKVEVQGRLFTGVARKPVVLVDALTVQGSTDDESDDAMDADSRPPDMTGASSTRT